MVTDLTPRPPEDDEDDDNEEEERQRAKDMRQAAVDTGYLPEEEDIEQDNKTH